MTPQEAPSSQAHRLRRAATALLLLALSGCTAWTPMQANEAQLLGPSPYSNQTPMNDALRCLKRYTKDSPIRLGVADFVDGSGASASPGDVSGRYLSQRPDLMLMVALNKAGIHLVNRTSTAVAEWEMRQAMDKKLGEGRPTVVGNVKYDYRPVRAGEFLGSDYYIHGAITEINWGLANNVEEYGFLGATAGKRTYRISIAVDLAVTNTATTEVILARSYAKQIVGYQVGSGAFRFVDMTVGGTNTELFEANIGDKKNEPVQQALRWLVESAAYDIVAELDGRHTQCDALVPGLSEPPPEAQVGVGGAFPFLGAKPRRNDEEPGPAALRPMPALRRPVPIQPPEAVSLPKSTKAEPPAPPAPQTRLWQVKSPGVAGDGVFSVRINTSDAVSQLDPDALAMPPALIAAMAVVPPAVHGIAQPASPPRQIAHRNAPAATTTVAQRAKSDPISRPGEHVHDADVTAEGWPVPTFPPAPASGVKTTARVDLGGLMPEPPS